VGLLGAKEIETIHIPPHPVTGLPVLGETRQWRPAGSVNLKEIGFVVQQNNRERIVISNEGII
jgi:hypothetical protein